MLLSHKNEMLPFLTKRMDLEGMVLSEMSPRKPKLQNLNNQTQEKQTQRHGDKWVVARGEGAEEGGEPQTSGYQMSPGDVKYRMGSVAGDTVLGPCGDRWRLHSDGEHFV